MDITAVLALAVLVGMLVGLTAYVTIFQKRQPQQMQGPAPDEEDEPVQAGGRRAANRMRGRELRNRRRNEQQQQQQRAAAAAPPGSDDDSGEDDEEEPLNRREQARRDRQEARAAADAARQAKDSKISAYRDKQERKEKEREERERAQAEEVRRAAEERQKADDEEAAKWLSMISVEQTGTVEEEAGTEDSGLLGRFIDYIQSRKMVPIEEAATEFGLRSSEVVDRIQGLESMGRLTGVMDERGKFIYISRHEMEAVAAHIRAKGRISIALLAAQTSDLIDLEARAAPAGTAAGSSKPAIDFNDMVGAADEPVPEHGRSAAAPSCACQKWFVERTGACLR
ncbi:DDRGK domain-containing protein [Scenedesmus sp. NREL 46B-D3]|nr:DDRGK domain-containing protein [Scenedesmus sp. NREL 46B-D3]